MPFYVICATQSGCRAGNWATDMGAAICICAVGKGGVGGRVRTHTISADLGRRTAAADIPSPLLPPLPLDRGANSNRFVHGELFCNACVGEYFNITGVIY